MKISITTILSVFMTLTIFLLFIFAVTISWKKVEKTAITSYDTSKCVLLVVDTTSYAKGTHFVDYEGSIISMGFAFMIKGYQVSKKEIEPFINKLTPISYLDKDKKPLSKKYIVWDSKFDY